MDLFHDNYGRRLYWNMKKIREFQEKNPNGITIDLITTGSFNYGYFHVFVNSRYVGKSRKYTYQKTKKFFERFKQIKGEK